MNKGIYSLVTLALGSLSAFGATQITSSTAPGTVLSEGVYEVNESVSLTGGTGGNGLSVAEGATVAVYLKKGVTLTLVGGKGSGTTPGGAGFCVPDKSTLILVGNGRLKATGGKSGSGGDGSNGGNGSKSGADVSAGYGGAGGAGAGGAGAGIGGAGGKGGGGAAQTESIAQTWGESGGWPHKDGKNGNSGSSGNNGGVMGVLYALGKVVVSAFGGDNVASPGVGGDCGTSAEKCGYEWRSANYLAAGGGGGGGGGGVSYDDACGIGGGSGGGGGGGSGGSGGLDCHSAWAWDEDIYAPKGAGGTGGDYDGENGEGSRTQGGGGNWGGTSGSAGSCGKASTNSTVYASDASSVESSTSITLNPAETHEFLKRTVTFDFQGGTLRGETSAEREAYLYLTLPDAPIPAMEGHLMTGYFTQPDGKGTQYYDSTGEPFFDFWNLDAAHTTLYAAWRECTPPPHALLVTKLGDEDFDPDSSNITFRAALTWAMLFPDLCGEDGTPSKVTFAEKLWQGKESVTVNLTKGKIRISECSFSEDRPLIVAGPGMGTCDIVIDAKNASLPDQILHIGEDNHVEISGLTFQNATSGEEGGAIVSKATSLRLVDCVFSKNTATASGGAVHAGAGKRLTIENCRFSENKAQSKSQGGGAVYGGERLTVINSTFLDGEAANGGAIWAGATNVIVNSSVFRNTAWMTGGGIYSGGSNDLVAVFNCTVVENMANCQEGTATGCDGGGGFYALASGKDSHVSLVNDFFIGNRQTSLAYPDVEFGVTNAISNLVVYASMFGKAAPQIVARPPYNVRTGKEEFKFFEKGTRSLEYRTLEKRGVAHEYLRTMDTDGDYGYSVFHDDAWENVAIASSATSGKASIVGDKNRATDLLMEDISTRPLAELCTSSQCGSYWFVHDRPVTVVTTIEDVDDWYDGLLSLREIIDGIATEEEKWFTNRVNGVYTITFDPKLIGQTNFLLGAQYDVYGTANSSNGTGKVNVVIDAETNRIAIVGSEGSSPYRAFRVMKGSSLTLRNLTIANCTGTPYGNAPMPGYDGGALINQGTTVVERCTFENCAGGPTADDPIGFGGALCNGPMQSGAPCSLTVRDSSFTGCRAAQGGAVYNYPSNVLCLSGCSFDGNAAKPEKSSVFIAAGGAAYNGQYATLELSGCTFANNTVTLDGQELSNDVYTAGAPYCTVSCVGSSVLSIVPTAAALPESSSESLVVSATATMPDGTPAVTMSPTGLAPGLSYALGHAETPDGDFTVDEGTWVRADASGKLNEPLRAPAGKNGGFYRVFVSGKK